ncbi:DUF4350 domain-containing protein [Schlesneria paludicola]|uniref:DUF4350 domain-containing protein n=1 Tax=Schlesneria paludicola TaxID=360056 RepID=UPI0012F9F138|nr:DUF4350 domain-containing protein [Schlesneria paludicola]
MPIVAIRGPEKPSVGKLALVRSLPSGLADRSPWSLTQTFGLVLLLVGHVLGAGAFSSLRAEPVTVGTPDIGWDGNYTVGRWTPVKVPIHVPAATSVQLKLSAVDSDGNRVGFQVPAASLTAGDHLITGLIKVGRLNGEVGIQVNDGTEQRTAPGTADWLREPLRPSVRLIVTIGQPQGFVWESDSSLRGVEVRVADIKASALPTNPLAYDSISVLVIAGAAELSTAQAKAVRQWVAGGGRLIISLPQDASAARQSIQSLSDWLPVAVGEQPVVVREFAGLEAYAAKNLRIPHTTTLSIPSVRVETGEVLAASRSDAFLVRAPLGLGMVTVLALDLTKPPLVEWKALPSLCARIAGLGTTGESNEKAAAKGTQLSSTGITDLQTQLNAIQEHFEKVQRGSPWFTMTLMLALMIVLGPLDYLLVHRILKRPQLTWVTYPLLVIITAGSTAWLAVSWNGTARHANQLDIVNVDVATSTATGRHLVTVYSPVTSQSDVSVTPLPLVEGTNASNSTQLIWQGVPEANFGGMLRPMGIEQGAKYWQQSDGQLSELPVMQWSSKALVAQSVQSVPNLVECDLKSSATGRLIGTITHRFSSPIEDWMVVYKNVVYRHLKQKDDVATLPLPSKQVWRVEQPGVHSRELRPYLTGMITMATPRFGERTVTEVTHHQSTYDPLSLDPASVIRILTFHDEVGGERYTGLTNQLLGSEDCSHLMKMGRAILVGRLSQPVATIQQDQQALEPDRQATFIRLILPVAPASEVIRDLRRVVEE